MHEGIVSLYALLVFTACLAVPYAIDQYLVPAKVPMMHIDNLERREVLMPSQQPTAPPLPQPQSAPAGPKPQFPANIIQKNDQPVVEKRGK